MLWQYRIDGCAAAFCAFPTTSLLSTPAPVPGGFPYADTEFASTVRQPMSVLDAVGCWLAAGHLIANNASQVVA